MTSTSGEVRAWRRRLRDSSRRHEHEGSYQRCRDDPVAIPAWHRAKVPFR
jgi:hypothetical protein